MIFFSNIHQDYGRSIKISLIFLQFGLFYLSLEPLSLEDSAVTPTILPLPVFHPIFILSFIGLKNLVIIIKPRTLTSSVHLTIAPTSFVFVVDSYQSSETLDYVILKVSFINGTVDVFYCAFTLTEVGVKLSIVL